jgi:signal transduction histidine kinase
MMLPYAWRLSISVVRAALGITGLTLFIVFARIPLAWGAAPLVTFVCYSLYALWRAMESDGGPLITLIVDTFAFVVWVALTADPAYGGVFWLGFTASAYVFLLACTALTQHWTRLAGVVLTCFLVVLFSPYPAASTLRPIVIWAGALGAIWVLHKRYLDERLSGAARQSVLFRYEAQRAREDERQRMAADFHDGPLQSFIGFQMRLEIVKKMLARDMAGGLDELKQLQELCRSQVGELRAFVRSMRPADVDGSSLGASISRMVEQFQKDTGIQASFLSGEYIDPAETEVSLELLQIVREALNNIQKHARATRVAVAIVKRGDYLEISVDDNGSGFPFSGAYSLDELDAMRLGPVSIRRRVRAIGGDLSLDSRPGHGAGLKVRISTA